MAPNEERNYRELDPLLYKLDGFDELKHDWDSYGAGPIDKRAIETGKNTLRRLYEITGHVPFVAPDPHGGVGFEYFEGPKGLVVDIDADGMTANLLLPDMIEYTGMPLADVLSKVENYVRQNRTM